MAKHKMSWTEKEYDKFMHDFNWYKDTAQKNEINKKIYMKFLVIKMLHDGYTYNQIIDETGFGRSTIPLIAKKFKDNKNNFYKDKRNNKSILNRKKYDIYKLLNEKVPSSLAEACKILENDKELNIKCGKTTMKEFLDRNNYNSLIIRDRKARNKKLKLMKGREYRWKRAQKKEEYSYSSSSFFKY